ncbi:MAG TPA: hypothetical protein PKE04_15430, partial [Clostridia bacterium]|nr:hypothetical protein [Clostridia bacterium]
MQSVFGPAKAVWCGHAAHVNAYVDFTDSFFIDSTGGAYRLRVSADAQYVLYVNDRFVDCGQYADFPDYKVYD